jgi:hypothetical protein
MVTVVRKFLEDSLTDVEELPAVRRTWNKAVHLHIALWTRPYMKDGLW